MEFLTGVLIGLVVGVIAAWLFKPKGQKDQSDVLESQLDRLKLEHNSSEEALKKQLDKVDAESEKSKLEYIKTISRVLEKSADSADRTSKELENVDGHVEHFDKLVHSINSLTDNAYTISHEGMEKLNQVVMNLENLSHSREELASIQEKFSEIQQRTESIRSIGEEAEMLALNAAIEAARAGDAGRGFAVVADSMKALSRNSQTATQEIKEIVEASDKEIGSVVSTFVDNGDVFNDSVQALISSFKKINDHIEQVESMAKDIQEDSEFTRSTVNKLSENTKTSVETLVKELTLLITRISGTEIVNLSPIEANQQLNDFDDVIDVRRPEEWNDELGHISEARLSTLQTDFPNEVTRLDPKKRYLFVCRSGGRSTKAAQMAINQGVKQVYNLDGGMLAWRKANLTSSHT